MKRISRIECNLEIAKIIAKRGTCCRANVGCVIVKGNRIISTGYNGPVKFEECKCDPNKPCTQSVHAEANAIAFAAKEGIALSGSTLYCTHSPCLNCASLIIQAGILEVIFIEKYRDTSGLRLLFKNHIRSNQYAKFL